MQRLYVRYAAENQSRWVFDHMPAPSGQFRALSDAERRALEANGCVCKDWDKIAVSEPFEPQNVQRCQFFGVVQIGALPRGELLYGDFALPIGLYDSRIGDCRIGDEAAIHRVFYLNQCRIGRRCLLFGIGALMTEGAAHFGVARADLGDHQPTIDIINENGRRRIVLFDSIRVGDAYLWATCRSDGALQKRFFEMAAAESGQNVSDISVIGDGCVARNVKTLCNVRIEQATVIDGADWLKNVSILSSPRQPTFIGNGAELEDGLVGQGCRIDSGATAKRFALGECCALELGARARHTILGDNSAIACCEAQHNLIFPSHQQHHNNSFLIAALLCGQSNIAAGATLGSNHNSRANDNELRAGRGFWPALCVSLKYPSRFASFALLAKGDFPSELDIPLPFSLISNNVAADRLEILPAYWWLYNLYALARNGRKFAQRDKRALAHQKIEHEPLAPDTIEEIFAARRLLEHWAQENGQSVAALKDLGKPIGQMFAPRGLLERSDRPVVIFKPTAAYRAYGQMILFFAVKTLLEANADENKPIDADTLNRKFENAARRGWDNVGGQIIAHDDVRQLRDDIRAGLLKTWQDVHQRLDALWAQYPQQKAQYAYAALRDLNGGQPFTQEQWHSAVKTFMELTDQMAQNIYAARAKDFEHPFYRKLFDDDAELQAVLGEVAEDAFIGAEKERLNTLNHKARIALGL